MTLHQIMHALSVEGYFPSADGGDNRTKSLSFIKFEGPGEPRFIVRESGYWVFCDAEKFEAKRDNFARKQDKFSRGKWAVSSRKTTFGSFQKLFFSAVEEGLKVVDATASEVGFEDAIGRGWTLKENPEGAKRGGSGAWRLGPK